MLSSEDAELYEVTCDDCNSTKSYFTAQGVSFFKASHEGHRVRVREPATGSKAQTTENTAVAPRRVEKPVAQTQGPTQPTARKQAGEGVVRLENLVVDVVDEEKGRAVKVYGIAGGVERFSRNFSASRLADLNYFLEPGRFADAESRTTYVWTPDRIDISEDVARMLDQGHATVSKQRVGPRGKPVEEPLGEAEEVMEPEVEPELKADPEPKLHAQKESAAVTEDRGSVRLGNLVVDIVDDGEGRSIKVYGVAGGHERFSRSFKLWEVDALNSLLESGFFVDEASNLRYVWSPDKIDLSADVVKMLDEPPAKAPEVTPSAGREVKTAVDQKVGAELVPEDQGVASPDLKASPSQSDGVLLGKMSYIQEGEEYRQESVRISRALRTFRWNIEPPYVIGAMFDNLMSIQSQNGTMMSAVIDSITELGYSLLAIEAPNGCVTAWFKKGALVQTPGSRYLSS